MTADATFIRGLKINEWPAADRLVWEQACRPSHRLSPGGPASHLKQVTREDLARRYGQFLDFASRSGKLNNSAGAAAHVTPALVSAYVSELHGRVSSVTRYGCIQKLRRITELLAPTQDFGWLRDIEQELGFSMRPAPKFERIVDSDRLVGAGLALMEEAEAMDTSLRQARAYRNGLMIALLACAPIRLKNYAALRVGRTLKKAGGQWWIVLGAEDTKSGRPDERPIPGFLTAYIDQYLERFRPFLGGSGEELWFGSTGQPLSYSACERIVTETTRNQLGIPISPHLFRSCAASSLALYNGHEPHLAAALLQHTDARVTERHYNRAKSGSYAQAFAELIEDF